MDHNVAPPDAPPGMMPMYGGMQPMPGMMMPPPMGYGAPGMMPMGQPVMMAGMPPQANYDMVMPMQPYPGMDNTAEQ
jgi:hypothetical protein